MSSVFKYVSKNLNTVEKNDLSFPFLDFGFLYGYGLFESIKIQNGIPQLLTQHVQRMKRGAIILEIPFEHQLDNIKAHVKELIEKNQVNEGILNFYLTPGDRNPDPSIVSSNSTPLFLMVMREWPNYPANYSVSLELRQESFKKTPLDRYKTLSWMKNILEKRLNPEVDDVLLFDENGYILETSRANVFFIKDELIFTPKSQVILPGIIRQFLLKNEDRFPYDIREADIHLDDLDSFNEIFLTNSLRGIFFVNGINERPALQSKNGAKLVQDRFLELMNQEVFARG